MMHCFAVPDRMRFHMKGKLSHGESANSDMNDREKYISPFSTRYASAQMQHIFSEDFKFRTWRRLWISLAKAEKKLGLDITDEQIAELEAHRDDVNFEVAEEREREVRHDVMSHVYAYGKQCPKAEGIIHLGATSCYVGDNTDVIILREASEIILKKAAQVVRNLSAFAEKYKALPCLAYTHLQPAQLTTVGKRATLWAYELCDDIDELEHRLSKLKLLGSKGTTGTQASFMELFSGDEEKVKKLESLIAEDMGFDGCVCVSGQTYSRKVDANFLATLSGFAQSAYKFANDLRILQSFEEVEEPFETSQVGSSAMPYKRNPMRCERICSLARYVMADAANAPMTASAQWLERTLDDSANRRISLPESFLAVDAILRVMQNVTKGLHVNEKIVAKLVSDYLPFIATENLMMAAVKRGGDRQQLHEVIREASMDATARMKNGESWDLVASLAADPAFGMTAEEIRAELRPERYIGRCPEQVTAFTQKCRVLIGTQKPVEAEELTL